MSSLKCAQSHGCKIDKHVFMSKLIFKKRKGKEPTCGTVCLSFNALLL